jgi:hypothetical protein
MIQGDFTQPVLYPWLFQTAVLLPYKSQTKNFQNVIEFYLCRTELELNKITRYATVLYKKETVPTICICIQETVGHFKSEYVICKKYTR